MRKGAIFFIFCLFIIFSNFICQEQTEESDDSNSNSIPNPLDVSEQEIQEEKQEVKDETPRKRKSKRRQLNSKSSSKENTGKSFDELLKDSEQSKKMSEFMDLVENVFSQHVLPLYVKLRKHEYFPIIIFTLLALKVLSILLSFCRSNNKKTLVMHSESTQGKDLNGLMSEINKGIAELKEEMKGNSGHGKEINSNNEFPPETLSELQASITDISSVMSNLQNSLLESQKEIIRDVVTIKKNLAANTKKSVRDNKTNSVMSRKSSISSLKEAEHKLNSHEHRLDSNKKEEPPIQRIQEETKKEVEAVEKIQTPKEKVRIPQTRPQPSFPQPKNVEKAPLKPQPGSSEQLKDIFNDSKGNELPKANPKVPAIPNQKSAPSNIKRPQLANPPSMNVNPDLGVKKGNLETFQSQINDPSRTIMKSSAVFSGENKVMSLVPYSDSQDFSLSSSEDHRPCYSSSDSEETSCHPPSSDQLSAARSWPAGRTTEASSVM